jgi:hypothetical protein
MTKRDILIGLGILGAFVLGAVILLVIVPNFKASEDVFPTSQPSVIAQVPTATTTSAPTSNILTVVTTVPATPTATSPAATPSVPASATPVPVTATPVSSPTTASKPASSIPQVTEQPYNLPKGIGPSDGARSCPQPLPVEKIRSDYLAYWDALVSAYREANPELLKPYIDTQAAGGKVWQGEQEFIQKMSDGGYYLDYQVEHSNPLIIKINPTFGGPGQCQVSVFDAVKLTSVAKKKNTNEPFDKNNATPNVRQYKPTYSIEMVVKNDHWVMAGEGAGQ